MSTSPLTVLVVDDHPTFRAGLKAVLATDPQLTVVGEAAGGEDAVARAHEADVVLMDLAMPGMGGVEATRRITASAAAARVLVLTMNDSDAAVFAALRAGARGYLLKDADPDEVIGAVHAVGEGRAVFGAGVAETLLAFFATGSADRARPFPQLSDREREVLELLAQGRDNAAIASALVLSRKTVRNHVSSVLAKLHATDRGSAIVAAREAGFGREAR